ncbi:hypothetical protein [Promicromonospora sp. NPDC019610]|uniref:hypothetical protein n=1 Tax=Promicromonospora sp. NPDC019610 TaxID=3364405 RepID=UPI0037B87B6D
MTTPPPPSDITTVFPELVGYERTTTMLHPRPGTPGVHDSSVGGPLLWPDDEPWPTVQEPDDRGTIPLVAVLQLWVRDFPELPHPEGMDVLQILWCPDDNVDAFEMDHFRTGLPDAGFMVVWRRSEDITDVLTDVPRPTEDQIIMDGYVPAPCVLAPEQVTEYPPAWVLGEAFDDHVGRRDDELDSHYNRVRTFAHGSKVGGWHADCGVGGPYFGAFVCDCGTPLSPLLSLASTEVAHTDRTTTTSYLVPPTDEPRGPECSEPTGLVLGNWTNLQLFYCTNSWDHPVQRYVM